MERCPNRLWWSQLRSIAARHCRRGASDAADDLAQDLALAALVDGAGVSNPGAWLERVARNATINRWRREQCRHQLANDVPTPAPPLDPEAGALLRERGQALRRRVSSLPRPQRRIALLRFHGDLSMDAVAARLGLRAGTARTRLHRALRALRADLQHLRTTMLFGWPSAHSALLSLTVLVAGVQSQLPLSPAAAPAAPPAITAPHLVQAHRHATPPVRPAPVVIAPVPVNAPPVPRPPAPATSSRTPRAIPAAPTATPPVPVVQRFSFDDDEIDADQVRPDGELVVVPRAADHPSLIELRADLLPELTRSLEEL